MKIVTILGTRPEIIRLSLTMKLLDKYLNHKIIHMVKILIMSLTMFLKT